MTTIFSFNIHHPFLALLLVMNTTSNLTSATNVVDATSTADATSIDSMASTAGMASAKTKTKKSSSSAAPPPMSTILTCIKNNDLSFLDWTPPRFEQRTKSFAMNFAAKHNHDAFKTLHQKYDGKFSATTIVNTAKYNVDNLIYMKNCGYVPQDIVLQAVILNIIRCSGIKTLQQLETCFGVQHLYKKCSGFMFAAISRNSSSMVEYLHSQECPWQCDRWDMSYIPILSSCKQALQTAYNLGCPMDKKFENIILAH